MGCQVFKGGLQNRIFFWPKISALHSKEIVVFCEQTSPLDDMKFFMKPHYVRIGCTFVIPLSWKLDNPC